jgi:glycosyltransferase involved in cell wall biosynthesis
VSSAFAKKLSSDLPLITVITVVFNGAKHLEITIRSVIDLKYPKLEYLVIDGGSTDGTLEIIKKYQHRIDKYISESDKGIYDAMNKGIAMANGDWINFMNCGDRFASETALNFFKQPISPEVDIVYGDATVEYHTFETQLKTISVKQFWKKMPFCHQATFVRTKLMKTYPFDQRYTLSSDFDFLYKAFMMKRKFQYFPCIICHFDYRDGASVKNALTSIRERKQIVLKWEFSFQKWIYYSLYIKYVHLSSFIKNVLGERITEWLIRSLNR